MQNKLDKIRIRELKGLMEKFQDSAAGKGELAEMIEENLQDMIEMASMAENAIDLEFQNERLQSKINWSLRGMNSLDM